MEKVGDDLVYNILGRVPPEKSLVGLRCVSKQWNRVISDLYFTKATPRGMILVPFSRPLVVLDDSAPSVEDKLVSHHRSPLQHQLHKRVRVSVIGTFNGIVLLDCTDHYESLRCELILYNPLTCTSKKLLVMDIPPSCNYWKPFVFGFGEDSKQLVRFQLMGGHSTSMYTWDVFDLQSSSWSGRRRYLRRDFSFWGDAGMFLNGFLYWVTSSFTDRGVFGILALNVKEMVFSRIKLPVSRLNAHLGPHLGSIDGSLCMVTTVGCTTFDLWVRRSEQEDSWLKARSFTIPYYSQDARTLQPVCILKSGKILFTTQTMLLVIYDPSKDTYDKIFHLIHLDEFEPLASVYCLQDIRCIEYVESLVSPFHI